jgi:hypothetical protein
VYLGRGELCQGLLYHLRRGAVPRNGEVFEAELFILGQPNRVVSLNCCDEVLSAEYHNIRASQGMKVS